MEKTFIALPSSPAFADFIAQCWKAHTASPENTRDALHAYLASRALVGDLIELSALACHIDAEHLGDWESGEGYYVRLHSTFPSLPASVQGRLMRQRAILHKARDVTLKLEAFQPDDAFYITALALPAATLRVSAQAGGALLSQLKDRVEVAGSAIDRRRLLAVVTANLMCDIVQRYELPHDMRCLLLEIAELDQALWSRIGEPSDIARSAYRLALARVRYDEPSGNGSGRYPRFLNIEA
ncbi:hypothetical protein [Pandoraea pulmonicola]|uniref:Uncharacterized protein n=1 Tax=Pandoraea pulmonicola TaxID=93221 RepID=A0AAJ5D1J5_PANPU|nr:hypothetical protein [Pandoraea pulmonicola]AJC23064.2 hypothetical protein RO07_04555 [Pandoraea pulmonicola]SUA91851.1 Uncharacterised protein [Pandoraea pulmonicola]